MRDGLSGSVILPGLPNFANPQYGHGVSALGDVVGSALGDYFIGRGPSVSGASADSIVCYGSARAVAVTVLQGCTCTAGAQAPVLTAGSQPILGTSIRLTVADSSNPGAPGAFVVGMPPAQPQPPCVGVVPGVVQPYALVAGAATTAPYSIGATPDLLGFKLRAQFAVFAPCGLALSNTFELTIGL